MHVFSHIIRSHWRVVAANEDCHLGDPSMVKVQGTPHKESVFRDGHNKHVCRPEIEACGRCRKERRSEFRLRQVLFRVHEIPKKIRYLLSALSVPRIPT